MALEVVVKLPAEKYGDWEKAGFAPEACTCCSCRSIRLSQELHGNAGFFRGILGPGLDLFQSS